MAARSPTSMAVLDFDEYQVGKAILASSFDDIFDNMEYYLDEEVMTISDCFHRRSTSDLTKYIEIYRYYFIARDDCGTFEDGSTHTIDVAVRAWTSGAGVDAEFRVDLYDSTPALVGQIDLGISGNVTPTWYGFSASYEIDTVTNGEECHAEILYMPDVFTPGTVYIGGIMMVDK